MLTAGQIVKVGALPTEYHAYLGAERGAHGHVMSSGELRAFATCPARWVRPYKGADGSMVWWEPPETPATRLGSLVDTLVLTPQYFHQAFAVIPEDAPRRPSQRQRDARKKSESTVEAIQFWDAFDAAAAGKTVVDAEEFAVARQIADAVLSDASVGDLLRSAKRQLWINAEWRDKETGIVVPTKALIDAVPDPECQTVVEVGWLSRSLIDLKTTRDASIRSWSRWAFSAGYHVQAAWYLDHARAAGLAEDLEFFAFILVETNPPYIVARRVMADDDVEQSGAINQGRRFYQRAMSLYCRCLAAGQWPDYDQTDLSETGWTPVPADPWVENAAEFGPHFVVRQEAEEQDIGETQGITP